MKKNKSNLRVYHPAYPNAASPRYFARKLLDAVTAVASGMGFLTVLIFFFLM